MEESIGMYGIPWCAAHACMAHEETVLVIVAIARQKYFGREKTHVTTLFCFVSYGAFLLL